METAESEGRRGSASRFVVWLLLGFFGLLVISGPLAYAVGVVVFGSGNPIWILWTGLWGLPWSIWPLTTESFVSVHVDEALVAVCAVFNFVLLAVILRVVRAKTNKDERIDSRSRAWKVGVLLASGSFLLVALGTVGVVYTGSLAHVEAAFEHPFVFGCAAALTMAVAVFLLVPWRWLSGGVAVICVCVAVLWGFVGLYFLGPLLPNAVGRAPAPPGTDYEAVLVEGADWIDTVWYVSIRQTRGLLSREWELGCITDDDPAHAFKSLAWDGRRTLVVTTERESARITVNPRTGHPTSSGSIWSC